ncbi:hypothetical protein DVH05_005795 [Phytophthora capsici]|nr:hypothetical protein DVH05_005795 [Phytophthora capsici]
MALDLSDIKTVLAVIKPKILTEFKTLSVCEDEFQLDSLSKTQESDSPIVKTPTLHEFWKESGEFPPYYFVRMEEVMFWQVIKKLLFSKRPIIFVGSPGVGKSCFLMLLAFYLACIEQRKGPTQDYLISRHGISEPSVAKLKAHLFWLTALCGVFRKLKQHQTPSRAGGKPAGNL